MAKKAKTYSWRVVEISKRERTSRPLRPRRPTRRSRLRWRNFSCRRSARSGWWRSRRL